VFGGLRFFLWIVGKFIVQESLIFGRAGNFFQAAPEAPGALPLELRSDRFKIKRRF